MALTLVHHTTASMHCEFQCSRSLTMAKYLRNFQRVQEERPYLPILECVVENFAETKQPDTGWNDQTPQYPTCQPAQLTTVQILQDSLMKIQDMLEYQILLKFRTAYNYTSSYKLLTSHKLINHSLISFKRYLIKPV